MCSPIESRIGLFTPGPRCLPPPSAPFRPIPPTSAHHPADRSLAASDQPKEGPAATVHAPVSVLAGPRCLALLPRLPERLDRPNFHRDTPASRLSRPLILAAYSRRLISPQWSGPACHSRPYLVGPGTPYYSSETPFSPM
jgi:hypothetical protein